MGAVHQKNYTYQDYLTWSDEKRCELIHGVVYDMAPAPRTAHQWIAGNIHQFLKSSLKGKKCKPFFAPTDVVFSEEDVVQPDVFVVCEPQKITEACIQGAPDLVIEVISPSSEQKDRWIKRSLYEHYGVREYVLINPVSQFVERYQLQENGLFDPGESFGINETLSLHSLDKLEIPLQEIFDMD